MPDPGWRHGIITPGSESDFDAELRAVCGWFDCKYHKDRPYVISEHPGEEDSGREYHVHIIWYENSNSSGLSDFIRNQLGLGFRTRRLFCFNHANAYLHKIGKRVVKVRQH